MTTTDLLSKEEYQEEVNRQAQHLVRAVDEADYDDDAALPHTQEAPDVLDGHEWFDGSNYMTHHSMIIEYGPFSSVGHHSNNIDSDNIESILRELAYYVFQEDVIQQAVKVSNH